MCRGGGKGHNGGQWLHPIFEQILELFTKIKKLSTQASVSIAEQLQ